MASLRISGEPKSSIVDRSSSSSFSVGRCVVFGSSISTSGEIVVSLSIPSVVSSFGSTGLTSTVRTLKITCPKSLC